MDIRTRITFERIEKPVGHYILCGRIRWAGWVWEQKVVVLDRELSRDIGVCPVYAHLACLTALMEQRIRRPEWYPEEVWN